MAQIPPLWLRSHRDDLHIHSRQDCFLAKYVTIYVPHGGLLQAEWDYSYSQVLP